MEGTIVCPVCTLYLRPGMTLKSHLESHPKQKVIEALVKLHSDCEPNKDASSIETSSCPVTASEQQQLQQPPVQQIPWMGQNGGGAPSPVGFGHVGQLPAGSGGQVPSAHVPVGAGTGNHSFFYQQFMSSSTPQPGYVNQQYVTIPIFNHQQMLPQYVYQQQQVFVTSGGVGGGANGGGGGGLPRLMPCPDPGPGLINNNQQPPHIVEIHDNDNDVEAVVTESIKDDQVKADQAAPGMPQLENQVVFVENIVQHCDNNDFTAEIVVPDAEEDVDLHKSCQTTQTLPATDEQVEPPQLQPEVLLDPLEEKHIEMDVETGAKYITLTNHAVDSRLENGGEGDHHAFDMDGMNLILGHEFIQGQNHIEDFDAYKYERPRILMNIGEFDNRDENISIDSANIRADENMPARGELSGQESNASDVASWSRLQYNEGSSRMSSTYDLLARESWEGSDASLDVDAPPPYQSRNPPSFDEDDDPVISGSSRQGIEYKCSSCDLSFICPKERRVHQAEVHVAATAATAATQSTSTTQTTNLDTSNVIGSQLFKKKIKKLVIKPKQTQQNMLKTEKIEESPFDHIFNNIMKMEVEGGKTEGGGSETAIEAAATKLLPASQPIIICVLCCAVIKDTSTLKQHQVAAHDFKLDTKYKCGVCNEAFTCEPKYTEHLTVHPLECQFCGKYFYRGHNMQLHIKRHMGIRPFKCISCEKNFLTRQKLQEHRHVHTGEAPLKCNMCNETFKRHSNLIQHRNRHHLMVKKKVKDFICAACGEIFHSKKKLAWHKEIHENKPKSCVHCSEKFIHASSLTRHVRRAHNERFVPEEERDRENVECPICKGIYLRSSLETHIKNHSGTKNYTCSVCDKDFTTKWNLKLHKWTHAGRAQKPYKCELCKGAFVRESDYTAHMNSHKSIRPYTCNYCGAQFIRKYNCQRHVKEHERVKTFSCTVCGKTFHRSYYLNDHMRIHSGIRPFSCHICGKTSTTKSNHNKHVRIHHAREPVSTEN